MIYQITAGQGPVECEHAVTKLAEYLEDRLNVTVIEKKSGIHRDDYKSVVIYSEENLDNHIGTVKCVFTSPYRPTHKRKNWFINFSRYTIPTHVDIDLEKITYDTFRSGGNGGQNVNKVESGVRLVYEPLDISIVCTEERSQLANKKKAMERLKRIIDEINESSEAYAKNENWTHHNNIQRGNESLTYYFND